MNQKAIRWILGLMSLSLIGLVSFQFYWIFLTINEKEEEFDKTLFEVLAEVDDEIQNSEATKFIKQFDINVRGDSSSNFHFFSTNNAVEDEFILKQTTKDSGLIINEIKNKVKEYAKDGNAIIVTSSTNQTIDISSSDSIIDEKQLIVQYTNKKNKLTEIVDRMSMEFAFEVRSLNERMEGVEFKAIIDQALRDKGIQKLDYSFTITAVDNDSLLYAELTSDAGVSESYDRTIFEEGNAESGAILSVHIPNKASYLIKSIWWLIIISLLLTGIMIYTFSYTIKAIFKQKKVAKIKADFINNMTHEFKTPVATISLAIDSMLHPDVLDKPGELNKFGSIIKKENQRMNDQIERLLEMALFDKEEIDLDLQPTNAHDIIYEIKNDFSLKSKKEDGNIQLQFNAQTSSIMVDKMHFYNVIRNIIDNAIKYSKDIFKIEVETLNKDSKLIISIRDNGIGMDEQTTKKIFDRFYRKSSGNIHSTKGFGLGLAYVKEILEKMKASISVKSEPNVGSEFKIEIPTS